MEITKSSAQIVNQKQYHILVEWQINVSLKDLKRSWGVVIPLKSPFNWDCPCKGLIDYCRWWWTVAHSTKQFPDHGCCFRYIFTRLGQHSVWHSHAAVDMANAFCQYLSGRGIRNSSYLLGLDKSTPLCSCLRAVIISPALCHNIVQRDLDCLDLWQNIIHHINDTNLIIILWQHPTPLCFTSVGAKP